MILPYIRASDPQFPDDEVVMTLGLHSVDCMQSKLKSTHTSTVSVRPILMAHFL